MNGEPTPPEALMHDQAATVPALIATPHSEDEVIRILESLKELGVYGKVPVSVKSDGHGYFNGASC